MIAQTQHANAFTLAHLRIDSFPAYFEIATLKYLRTLSPVSSQCSTLTGSIVCNDATRRYPIKMFSTAMQCLCAIGVIQAACALRMPSGTLAQGQATAGGSTQSQYMYVQHAMHKKHGKHHGHHHHGHSSDSSVCEEGVWREKVLKLVHEIPVAGKLHPLHSCPSRCNYHVIMRLS